MLIETPDLGPAGPRIERRYTMGLAAPMQLRTERDRGTGAPHLTGYAAVFNKRSVDLGGFVEIVGRSAFTRSLDEGADVRALVDHDPSRILGRVSAGTLLLDDDPYGLKVDITPADTQAGRDIVESIRRGDVREMSFAFSVRPEGEMWTQEGSVYVRTIIDADLFDVSIVTYPAYPDTTIAVRRLQEALTPATPDEARLREAARQLARRTSGRGVPLDD